LEVFLVAAILIQSLAILFIHERSSWKAETQPQLPAGLAVQRELLSNNDESDRAAPFVAETDDVAVAKGGAKPPAEGSGNGSASPKENVPPEQRKAETENGNTIPTSTENVFPGGSINNFVREKAFNKEKLNDLRNIRHGSPNPGGLILSACFSYMQDPREVNRKKKLPHVLPTYENIYHYHTTVVHRGLHAIIFHDDASFNSTFVERYESEYIKFVRIEAPSFGPNDPVISPNDYRYVVFSNYLKSNSHSDDGKTTAINGVWYNWMMISDLDMIFQRNPFPLLDRYAAEKNVTFFGSWDGGAWREEQMRLQRRLFRNCYGRPMILKWKEELEWKTPNGNCGLWAGRYREVKCILDCMAGEYDRVPIKGKGSSTICDMVTHDYCVHYGGCFPESERGVYDAKKVGVLWGEQSMGKGNELFGPPYGRYRQCDRETWSVLHNRCDWKGPLCFRKDEKGELVKYHQLDNKGKRCRIDPVTDLPVDYYDEPKIDEQVQG